MARRDHGQRRRTAARISSARRCRCSRSWCWWQPGPQALYTQDCRGRIRRTTRLATAVGRGDRAGSGTAPSQARRDPRGRIGGTGVHGAISGRRTGHGRKQASIRRAAARLIARRRMLHSRPSAGIKKARSISSRTASISTTRITGCCFTATFMRCRRGGVLTSDTLKVKYGKDFSECRNVRRWQRPYQPGHTLGDQRPCRARSVCAYGDSDGQSGRS